MMSGPKSDTTGGSLSCIKTQCDAKNSCVYRCFISDLYAPPLPLPPPPPPPPPVHLHPAASQSHMAPFLIAAVCILGISFLLLTTCTIILRWRFTRRRRNRESGDGSDGEITTDDSEMAAVSGGGFDHPIWHITTVGLQQSVIDSITAFKYKKVDNLLTEGSDCSVCLTEFEEDDDLRFLPKCSHAFHLSCIDMWLGSHKNCPICRAPVVNESFTGSNLAARSERWSYLRDNSVAGEENQSRGESSGSSTGGGSSGGGGGGEKEIRIAELLKKNGELRVLSDLGVNYRFGWVDEEEEGLETIKRSFSFNALAVTAICEVVGNGNNGIDENEGNRCSGSDGSNASVGLPDVKLEVENVVKGGSSSGSVPVPVPVPVPGMLTDKSPTIGRSFQEGAVSVMRSMSSGGKLFSFRRTKSQASILPL